jgi:hypothetical protein
MKLFCPDCKEQLILKLSIELDMLANFHWTDDNVVVTKYIINKTRNCNRIIKTSDIESLYCTYCNKDIEVPNTLFICDNCRNFSLKGSETLLGKTLVICKDCTRKESQLENFLLFGKRNLRPDRRNTLVQRIVNEAAQNSSSAVLQDVEILQEMMRNEIGEQSE